MGRLSASEPTCVTELFGDEEGAPYGKKKWRNRTSASTMIPSKSVPSDGRRLGAILALIGSPLCVFSFLAGMIRFPMGDFGPTQLGLVLLLVGLALYGSGLALLRRRAPNDARGIALATMVALAVVVGGMVVFYVIVGTV